jgi:hypothetical protein
LKFGNELVFRTYLQARRSIPIISQIREYGFELMSEFGIDTSQEK